MGERLKSERVRAGFSQVAFSEACEVNRGTLATWEKGEQTPNAAVLAVMAGLGLDVLYIVTGAHIPQGGRLSPAEAALLDSYAQADEAGRAVLQGVAELAKRSAGANPAGKGGNTVTIGGDVGQAISGDQHNAAPVSFSVGKGRRP